MKSMRTTDVGRIPNTAPLPLADAELLYMAYLRLMRCDPAGCREGTVGEVILTRLGEARYKIEYVGDKPILIPPKD